MVHFTQHCRQDHIWRYSVLLRCRCTFACCSCCCGRMYIKMCLHHWHTVTYSKSVKTRTGVLYGLITAQLPQLPLIFQHILVAINCDLYISHVNHRFLSICYETWWRYVLNENHICFYHIIKFRHACLSHCCLAYLAYLSHVMVLVTRGKTCHCCYSVSIVWKCVDGSLK